MFCLVGWLAPLAFAHEGLHEQIVALTQQIQTEPRNAQLYLLRGELHRLHRDWEAARNDFAQVAKLAPAMCEIEFSRGRLWLDAHHSRLAIVAFTRFLVHQPAHAEALILRARAYQQSRRYKAAAADYARAIALLPRAKPDHYVEHAETLALAGQPAAAVRALDAGIAQLGSLVTLQLKAIELETKLNRWDAALVRVTLLASQTPRQETWLVKRAEILQQAGRWQAARTAYGEALQAIATLPPAQRQTRAMDNLAKQIAAGSADVPVRKIKNAAQLPLP